MPWGTDYFLGMNVIIIGTVLLVVVVYLITLINKRRKDKFLHENREKEPGEKK